MKILCDLVKGATYQELNFVDGEMPLVPVTWARWIILPNLLGIQGHRNATAAGSEVWEMVPCLVAFFVKLS